MRRIITFTIKKYNNTFFFITIECMHQQYRRQVDFRREKGNRVDIC